MILYFQTHRSGILFFLALLFSVSAVDAHAQKFTFQFKNPGFGGHPNNFHYFLTSAELQKDDFSDSAISRAIRTPLDDFQRTMQRQLLNQLSRQLVSGEIEEFDFNSEGTYDLGDFTIRVTPDLDAIHIEVTDQLSGERTQIEIPRF